MTREQIAHMRYGVEIGEYKQVNEEVGRLLDEREALLKAARELLERGPLTDDRALRAAIAKAEAE